jgi:hypothetical protein
MLLAWDCDLCCLTGTMRPPTRERLVSPTNYPGQGQASQRQEQAARRTTAVVLVPIPAAQSRPPDSHHLHLSSPSLPPHMSPATLKAPPRASCPRGRGPTEAAHNTLSPAVLGLWETRTADLPVCACDDYLAGVQGRVCRQTAANRVAPGMISARRCCSTDHLDPTRAAFGDVVMHHPSLPSLPSRSCVCCRPLPLST